MNEKICPYFDRCFIRSIMSSIEIPLLLRYCQQGYANCRYFSNSVQPGYVDKQTEEASVI